MALEKNDLQILAEIGFCAVGMGNMLPARTIFEGLAAARPGHEAPRMGLAMSHYMVNEFEAAESILRGLMQDKPDFRLANAHLALCLILADRKDEAQVLLRDLGNDKNPQYSGMVEELLGLAV
ncbi:MAG: tetratricopeptide repeat protein [Deltaproteobacteria bacterium]|nr:tetratricopeptide repeat protein [Deltaproteobacteria bacterium]